MKYIYKNELPNDLGLTFGKQCVTLGPGKTIELGMQYNTLDVLCKQKLLSLTINKEENLVEKPKEENLAQTPSENPVPSEAPVVEEAKEEKKEVPEEDKVEEVKEEVEDAPEAKEEVKEDKVEEVKDPELDAPVEGVETPEDDSKEVPEDAPAKEDKAEEAPVKEDNAENPPMSDVVMTEENLKNFEVEDLRKLAADKGHKGFENSRKSTIIRMLLENSK